MKAMRLVCVMFILTSAAAVRADRVMEKTEILDLFSQLTSHPRTTWIQSGTIQADHVQFRGREVVDDNEVRNSVVAEIRKYRDKPDKVEVTEKMQKMRLDAVGFNARYRLANESTTESTELTRCDGNRFYWEITVNSRHDSIVPGSEVAGNMLIENFNLDWNRTRISAWDGQNYTRYSLPGNEARIFAGEDTQHRLAGVMIAGLVPWGYGRYSYKTLSLNDLVGAEKLVDGQLQIQITMANPDGTQEQLVFDPSKDYAVKSQLITQPTGPTMLRQNAEYQLVGDAWVPGTILEEQYEAGTNRVLKSDLWTVTDIDAKAPAVDGFNVKYQDDAVVEVFSPVTAKSVIYRNCLTTDGTALLSEKLALEACGTRVNCATAAAKHVAADFGKDISYEKLAPLIDDANNTTSMLDLERSLEDAGLYCAAVRTDVDTLKGLPDARAILYFPATKHFVVVDHIDADRVWVIDLTSRKFFFPIDTAFFDMDWPDGTALLVADRPIGAVGDSTTISSDELNSIIGTGYICMDTLQRANKVYCLYSDGDCSGYYQRYYERYGCDSNPTGSCSTTLMLRKSQSKCIVDFYSSGEYGYYCNVTGDWTDYYMPACE